jgi:excinuclease ABC subunit A
VAKVKASYTGQYLAEILATNRAATATKTAPRKTAQKK